MDDGIANGDRILTLDEQGQKYQTIFYDGTKGRVYDLQALSEKLANNAPVFSIQYRPRERCQVHTCFLTSALRDCEKNFKCKVVEPQPGVDDEDD